MFEKKDGVKKEILKIEKLQGKEIKSENKREMAEAFSGKWESVKDSTDIEKGFGTFKEVTLSTTKKSGRNESGEGRKKKRKLMVDRGDFRQLIKVLADRFKVRIEMRQIGARQEAGRIGGIGPCGRELCCSSWITNFVSVTTNAARYQEISLNPQKLAGQCGKLKCCLNYELDTNPLVQVQSRPLTAGAQPPHMFIIPFQVGRQMVPLETWRRKTKEIWLSF